MAGDVKQVSDGIVDGVEALKMSRDLKRFIIRSRRRIETTA